MIYGYIRVSTDRQTVENQRFEINNYCAKNNLQIDEWISETVSGKVLFENRKLGRLLKKTKKNDTIICTEISRLSRRMYSMFSAMERFEKSEVEVITTKQGIALRKDKFSKYVVPIFAIASEMERDLISQRTKEALARKKAQGIKLGRPFGSKSKNRKLSGKEETVKSMLNENFSVRKIAKRFKINEKTLRNFIREKEISQLK
jgi:DNA invertase Pin-like site-specific DNA recombinase